MTHSEELRRKNAELEMQKRATEEVILQRKAIEEKLERASEDWVTADKNAAPTVRRNRRGSLTPTTAKRRLVEAVSFV